MGVNRLGIRLQDSNKLRGFGLFSQSRYSRRNKDDIADEIDVFVEEIVKNIDKRFLKDPGKYRGTLVYALSGMLSSLINTRENIEDKTLDGMNFEEYDLYRFIHKIINESENPEYSRWDFRYFDHIYWYWLEPDKKDGGNPSSDSKRYLCIESHPYMTLDNKDIEHFAEVTQKHGKYFQIEVLPGSHYFIDRTLYLRFILDTKNVDMEYLKEKIDGYFA